MKRTQKYSRALELLTFPHQNQDQLYSELNRLGWYWEPRRKEWIRDDTPAKEASKLIRIRLWTASDKIADVVDSFVEIAEDSGLRLLEKSEPYPCRPPNQNDSRVYLTFEENSV